MQTFENTFLIGCKSVEICLKDLGLVRSSFVIHINDLAVPETLTDNYVDDITLTETIKPYNCLWIMLFHGQQII